MTTAKDGVHRLLDIVVEEVSLVDRAANKHRFLIVKRSDSMEENETKTTGGEAGGTADRAPPKSTAAGPVVDPAAKAGGEPQGSSMLEAAVEALERLTETVETLGALAEGDARERIGEIATELRALADHLVESAGAGAAAPPKPDGDLAAVIGSVRTTLQRVGSLIDATKATSAKAKPKPDTAADDEDEKDKPKEKTEKGNSSPPAANPAGPASEDPFRKAIGDLADSVKKAVDSLKDQAQRLSKLEKRFGLPNSAPAREEGNRHADDEVGWPMDLNRPFGRENVDKAVSFHDP